MNFQSKYSNQFLEKQILYLQRKQTYYPFSFDQLVAMRNYLQTNITMEGIKNPYKTLQFIGKGIQFFHDYTHQSFMEHYKEQKRDEYKIIEAKKLSMGTKEEMKQEGVFSKIKGLLSRGQEKEQKSGETFKEKKQERVEIIKPPKNGNQTIAVQERETVLTDNKLDHNKKGNSLGTLKSTLRRLTPFAFGVKGAKLFQESQEDGDEQILTRDILEDFQG